MSTRRPDTQADSETLVENVFSNEAYLRAVIRRRLDAAADHDGVFSDLLLKAHEVDTLGTYARLSDAQMRASLAKTATRLAYNANRARRTSDRYEMRTLSLAAPDEPGQIAERNAFLTDLLGRLDDDAALLVDDAVGYDSSEVAARHGLASAAAVRQRTHRRTKAIRDRIAADWGGGVPALIPGPLVAGLRVRAGRVASTLRPEALAQVGAAATAVIAVIALVVGGTAMFGPKPAGGDTVALHKERAGVPLQDSAGGAGNARPDPEDKPDENGRDPKPYSRPPADGGIANSGIAINDPERGSAVRAVITVPEAVPIIGGTPIWGVEWATHCNEPEHPDHNAEACAAAATVGGLIPPSPMNG